MMSYVLYVYYALVYLAPCTTYDELLDLFAYVYISVLLQWSFIPLYTVLESKYWAPTLF